MGEGSELEKKKKKEGRRMKPEGQEDQTVKRSGKGNKKQVYVRGML